MPWWAVALRVYVVCVSFLLRSLGFDPVTRTASLSGRRCGRVGITRRSGAGTAGVVSPGIDPECGFQEIIR